MSNLVYVCFEHIWNKEINRGKSIDTLYASNYTNEKLLDKAPNDLHIIKMEKDRLMAENVFFGFYWYMVVAEKWYNMNQNGLDNNSKTEE